MDVTGGRVDVGMTKQSLHNGEIDARFGKRGAEGVPKRVRVAAWDASRRPVIAKDRAQARRSQRLTAVGSFGHHEQAGGLGLWTFGEQVGLNDPSNVDVKGNTALFGSFAAHSVAKNSTTSVTLSGTEFASGAKITGPKGVTFSMVNVVNSSTITATMKVSGSATTGSDLSVSATNDTAAGYGKASAGVLTIT